MNPLRSFTEPVKLGVRLTRAMSIINELTIAWLEPWRAIADPASRRQLERELNRELAKGHPLFGRSAEAVGRRCDCDDYLFVLRDPDEWAVVHLAFASRPDRPPWPIADLFSGVTDFIERRMKADHAEFTAAG